MEKNPNPFTFLKGGVKILEYWQGYVNEALKKRKSQKQLYNTDAKWLPLLVHIKA